MPNLSAKSKLVLPAFFAVLVFCVVSCQKETDLSNGNIPKLPATSYEYVNGHFSNEFQFTPFMNQPDTNMVTNAGATLGRVLFYDGRLSLNNSVACATCHKQQFAFSDKVQFSTGFESKLTSRNSLPIFNAGDATDYFWDFRAQGLENQVLMPVKNHIEMGLENMDNLERKLNTLDYYPPLFEAAFGTPTITKEKISLALAQFLRSMVSSNSKYDQRDVNLSNFTPLEQMGHNLFFDWSKTPCSGCHGGRNFSGWGSSWANIGLDNPYSDVGMAGVDKWKAMGLSMDGFFKIPSLRNIELTAPYMHDGRYNTLEEVVEFYNSGVNAHPNLDYRLTTNGGGIFFEGDGFVPVNSGGFDNGTGTTVIGVEPMRLNLNATEKKALVAFLKTLTDREFITDPKYSDPFKY